MCGPRTRERCTDFALLHKDATVGNIVMWALLTGGITGGVWVSIVLLANHARLRAEQRQLGAAIEARREELALLELRLSTMEQRQVELPASTVRDGLLKPPMTDR